MIGLFVRSSGTQPLITCPADWSLPYQEDNTGFGCEIEFRAIGPELDLPTESEGDRYPVTGKWERPEIASPGVARNGYNTRQGMVSSEAREFFVSGGTMPLDSRSYVERKSDRLLFEALLAGKFCYLLNSRQMGKSSLSIRVIAKLREAGVQTAFVDLTRVGGRNVTVGQWYAGLCDDIGGSLNCRGEMLGYFRKNPDLSPLRRFFGALQEVLLDRNPDPIVLFFDEIDAAKNLPFESDEFFAGIRECFNRRVQVPELQRLTFCLIGVAVPTDLIRNPSLTPFNIGERIPLSDFQRVEMECLANGLGADGSRLLDRVYHWTSGQPFLTQALCQSLAAEPSVQTVDGVDRLVQATFFQPNSRTTNVNLADVGNRAVNSGINEPDPDRFKADLLSSYERCLRGGSIADDESNRVSVSLKLTGLVKSDGSRLTARNRIYLEVFGSAWIKANMPGQELERQRQAFRRGVGRTVLVSGAVLAIVVAMGVVAFNSERRALEAREALNRELYVADMNNMRLFEETGDVLAMESVLSRTKDSPYRGFEWSYWQRRLHDCPEEYTFDYSAPGKREVGVLSWDGTQICIEDSLAGLAAIIDRTTRSAVAVREIGRSTRIGRTSQVVATHSGFVNVAFKRDDTEVTDLLTGRLLAKFGQKGALLGGAFVRDKADVALSMERTASGTGTLCEWRLRDGRVLHSWPVARPAFGHLELALDESGSRALYTEKIGNDPRMGDEAVVIDVESGQTKDTFPSPPASRLEDFSASGKLALWWTHDYQLKCRRIDEHQDLTIGLPAGEGVPNGVLVSSNDKNLIEVYSNGRLLVQDLATGQVLASRDCVWQAELGDRPERILACSASVKLLDISEPHGERTVLPGNRVGRYGDDELVVFRDEPKSLTFLADPGLKTLGVCLPIAGMRNDFVYNGRWRLLVDGKKQTAFLSDTSGLVKPVALSDVPINFSAGLSREHVAILEKGQGVIAGVSGLTGAIQWKVGKLDDLVHGLWVTPDDRLVLALVGETELLVLDASTGAKLGAIQPHNVRLANVFFAEGGRKLFTCGADGRVVLWDLRSLRPLQEFRGNIAQRVSSATLSPDGSRVATSNEAGVWQLWDSKTGSQLMNVQASTLPLQSVIFTSDGKSILASGAEGEVRQWTTTDVDPSVRAPVPQSVVRGIAR